MKELRVAGGCAFPHRNHVRKALASWKPDGLSGYRKDMSESIEERVLKVIAKTQRIPVETVSPQSSFEELGIDSMDSINILFDLESEFDIEIDDEQARHIRYVHEMIDGVTKLLEAKEKASHAN
jgi:acyl carrier protein